MARTLVDAGVYDASEVAHLLGQPVGRVVRWAVSDSADRPAVVEASLGRSFSFVDLVSMAVAGELAKREVSEIDLRRGVAYLVSVFHYDRPLARRDVVELLATSGTALLVQLPEGWYDVGRAGQGAFEEVVRLSLRHISYDDLGVSRLWRPAPMVVLDPTIQAGAPCIEGTRVPTSVVASLAAVDADEVVADDLDLSVAQVRAARDFEATLDRGLGLAA